MGSTWVRLSYVFLLVSPGSEALVAPLQAKCASRGGLHTRPCQGIEDRETLSRSALLRRFLLGLGVGVTSTVARPKWSSALESDEFEEVFEDRAVGIELQDVRYRGSSRVLVKRVFEGGAAASRPRIKPNMVVVSANGEDLERKNAVAAKEIIKTSARPLVLVFRDASMFNALLRSDSGAFEGSSSGAPIGDETVAFQPITTKVAPGGTEPGEEGQVLKVLASTKSSACESCKGARKGDLLEIEYTGRLQDGKVFDGSSIKVNGREVVGRGGDRSLFFVLGKQPRGQFPPGWDLMLTDMCVGESRVISVPPLLGYGTQGLPRRGVPPNSTLLYDVKLVGVNGVNMCVS
ncbi:unnamed protein product [Ascophyllum nodosum]